MGVALSYIMTLKNRISNAELKKLEGNNQGRDELLLRRFGCDQKGLTQERLNSIRSFEGSLYDKARFAAEVLFKSLLELEVPVTDIHAQFTLDNLTALVYEEGGKGYRHKDGLGVAIRENHMSELQDKIKQFNFRDLSCPQLFRESFSFGDTHLYQGNLYEARSSWKKFQPSNEDFLNNISIPSKINVLEALLLGIYWADGYLRKSKDSLTMKLRGEQSDLDVIRFEDVYKGVVAHLLKSIHNYGPISGDSYIKERETRIGTVERYPSFEINSAAICTWLRDDLGFPPQQRTKGVYEPKKLPFEHLKELESKQGFFAGMMAGLGIINENRTILFEHKDKEFIEDIAELCKMIDYSPSSIGFRHYAESHKYHAKHPIWYFTLPRQDIEEMVTTDLDINLQHMGLFLNPRHYTKL